MTTITLTKPQEQLIRFNEYDRYMADLKYEFATSTDPVERASLLDRIDTAQAVWGFMHDPIEDFWEV